MTTPTIENADDLPGVLGKVDRALEELQARQGSGRSRPARSALRFERVEIGKSRQIREANVFHENWSGVPVVFIVVNPQGGARALAVRPTVVVEDARGNILQGPANARWANPAPPNAEEVERDIPANGAPVAIDTVIQGVDGTGFWLATDEGLRRGLKANTDRIEAEDIRVTVSLQGENVATISKTVRVRRGFPNPALGDGASTDTVIPPPPPKEPPETDPDPLPDKPASGEDHHSAAQRSRHPVGLKEALAAERDEGYKLLNALKGGPVTSWRYDRIAKPEDVESWSANIEHLLRDKQKMLYLFKYKPLTPQAISSVQDLARAFLGQDAAVAADMERLLAQLDKVIEAL
jgi:hypothetical protein